MGCVGGSGVVSRRGFLKLLGAGAAAIVAAPILGEMAPKIVTPTPSAPLFVPSERLDFGVPTQRLVMSADVDKAVRETAMLRADEDTASRKMADSVPMLLLLDNYMPKYGGKLKAGTEILADRETARRWMAFNVAVPAPSAPSDMQDAYVRRDQDERNKIVDAYYHRRSPKIERDSLWQKTITESIHRPPWVYRDDNLVNTTGTV